MPLYPPTPLNFDKFGDGWDFFRWRGFHNRAGEFFEMLSFGSQKCALPDKFALPPELLVDRLEPVDQRSSRRISPSVSRTLKTNQKYRF